MLDLTQILESDLPKRDIKAVFFDIDGTLLRKDGTYSHATLKQIKRLQRLGIKTGAATGRPHFGSVFLAEELGLDDFGVYCTGAHVFRPRDKVTLFETSINLATVESFLTLARDLGVYHEVYSANAFCVDHGIAPHVTREHSHHMRVQPQRSAVDAFIKTNTVHKLLIGADSSVDDNNLAILEAKFPELIFAYAHFPTFPTWRFASIVSSSACKKTAFERLLAHYQIHRDNVISFGDSQSDMVFLAQAGFGVAMGNASDQVKQGASYVTKTVDEDGIAYALEMLVSAHPETHVFGEH